MQFDPAFALNTLIPINTAAYQLSWDQTVTLPPGWTQVASITVDRSQVDRETASKMAQIAIAEDCNWGVAARKDDVGVVAIRGTDNRQQWLEDFDALARPVSHGAYWVHCGFEEVYSTIRDSVAAAIKAVSGCRTVYITGHSLGAALALLAGLDNNNANTWTFAGPRVFGPGARLGCYRVVNHWDIVPNVPVPPIYEHVGENVGVDGGFTLEAGIAHGLDTAYGPGLKKLIGTTAQTATAHST